MSVLSVAQAQAGTRAPDAPGDTNSQTDSDTADQRLDIADRLTAWLEDFLSGLVPLGAHIELDWGTLSPLLSTVSALTTAALTIRSFI